MLEMLTPDLSEFGYADYSCKFGRSMTTIYRARMGIACAIMGKFCGDRLVTAGIDKRYFHLAFGGLIGKSAIYVESDELNYVHSLQEHRSPAHCSAVTICGGEPPSSMGCVLQG